jgi:hypothetical protein
LKVRIGRPVPFSEVAISKTAMNWSWSFAKRTYIWPRRKTSWGYPCRTLICARPKSRVVKQGRGYNYFPSKGACDSDFKGIQTAPIGTEMMRGRWLVFCVLLVTGRSACQRAAKACEAALFIPTLASFFECRAPPVTLLTLFRCGVTL